MSASTGILAKAVRPGRLSGPVGDVIVVGSGMGGLAAGLRLSLRGLAVTVVDRAPAPGGKIRQLQTSLGAIDLGPTVLTMRWVFDELLSGSGLCFDNLADIEPLEVIAHHRWPDGSRLDLYADTERCRDAVGRFAGMAELRRHDHLLAMAGDLYRGLEQGYLRQAEPSMGSLLRRAGPAGVLALCRAQPFASLWRRLGQYLRDDRLRQLYARYATYCGSSPLDAPATLMLIAHVERQGVWRVDGGLGRLATALADAAERHGAQFRHGESVDAIEVQGGRATGVRLRNGETLRARAVLMNGDVRDLRAGGLGQAVRKAVRPSHLGDRSLSAVTWAGLDKVKDTGLGHHNVFFSADYPAEFKALFDQHRLPRDPTVYLCAADRPRRPDAGVTPERLFFLVNAPADGDRPDFDTTRCASEAARRARGTLARCGLDVDLQAPGFQATTPGDFHGLFPSTGGALYGAATHGWRAAFSRSGCRSRLPGLYLAGGSVHPGPGVPMAALSGLAAADRLAAELGALPRAQRKKLTHV
jgi:1-hydroxycarotenoid 3,4-desaturase